MVRSTSTSRRVIIVGGGVSGLAIATRLAQAGVPVTVLEASQPGCGASTRNQGWLFSGAWFARDRPDVARMCHESLERTLEFSPDCLEPGCGPMVFLMRDAKTDPAPWTAAWSASGIPWRQLNAETVSERFPRLAASVSRNAFELPDRAIRTDRLLGDLAAAAQSAGAEIRAGAPVSRLIYRGGTVRGVETGSGEVVPARLVVLAGNARGGFLCPGFGTQAVGNQPQVALVALKTHLVALQPHISRWPMCIVDAGGFNHVPHPPSSVFGSNRWLPVRDAEDERADPRELERIWDRIGELFPRVRREDYAVREWAGTTVQALHAEQIEPGGAPLPTVVDHELEDPRVENLLSVFPGRATLWPHLAEQARDIVLQKVGAARTQVATPPWGAPVEQWQPARPPVRAVLYHCQRCGNVASRDPRLDPPVCCDRPMASAGERAAHHHAEGVEPG